MKPLRQLETLDDLLAQAAHYAEFCLRNSGKMSPTLFLIGAGGPLMFLPQSLADVGEKDAFATTARLLCMAHDATAVVMALEAWLKAAKPGEKFDLTEPPSEAFDRQEVIILTGESRMVQRQIILPMIRRGNGKFFGFGESDLPAADRLEGRFAQLLPPQPTSPEIRALAVAVLRAKGVNIAKPGTSVKLAQRWRR